MEPTAVVLRYAPGHNPNGSERDIAGVTNAAGNVFGPHAAPRARRRRAHRRRADGLRLFASLAAAAYA